MQKFYSAPCGRVSAIVKTFFLTIFSLVFLNFCQVKAQAGNNLSYDGTDDYVNIAPGVVQSLSGDFTIEAWVYWRDLSNTGWERIIDFGNDQNNWIALTTALPAGYTNLGPRFAIMVGGTIQNVDAPTTLTPNQWNHIAVTLDNSTNTAKIYINGLLSNTTTGFTLRPSALGSTTNNWIGKSEFPDPYFNGMIDELRISNVVRYTTNFAPVPTTEFTTNPGDLTTVALYHFNEGTGTTTADAKGNFNATLAASPSTPTWVGGSILPIRLTTISATANNNAVDIKWAATLDHESEFVIERSSTGSTFSPVGVVSAAATGSLQSFSFKDNKPLSGRSYYRLKCTEVGSPSFYSRLITVVISDKEDIIVYPNPVRNGSVTIELPKAYTGNVELTLSSSSGSVVLKQKINAVDRKEFQIPKMAVIVPGVYVLQINTDKIKKTKTIVYQ